MAEQLPSHFVPFVRKAVRNFNFTLSGSLLAFHTTKSVGELTGRNILTETSWRHFLSFVLPLDAKLGPEPKLIGEVFGNIIIKP